MKDTVIPIRQDDCQGLGHLVERPPQLLGETAQLQRLIDALQPAIQAEVGAEAPVGGWLRSLSVEPGEATLILARELGSRGRLVATLAFDTLRGCLHDTDIYVRFEPA